MCEDIHSVVQYDSCDAALPTKASSVCGGETVQHWSVSCRSLLFNMLHMNSGRCCSIQQTIGLRVFLYHKHCLSVLEPLQCCCLVLWSKSYSLFTLPCLVAICVYTADTDKTRQFCLVHVGGVNKLLGLSNTEYHDVVPVVTGYYYWLLSPSGYYRKHLTCSVK